jgi:hypothetical protein
VGSAKQRAAQTSDDLGQSILKDSIFPLWAGEKLLGCAPLEPLHLDPSAHDDQTQLIQELEKQLLVSGRRWFWLVVDGSPAVHMQQLAHTRVSSIRVRVAPLHEYLNMMKAWQELAFPVLGNGFAIIVGYESDKAKEYVLCCC